MRSTTFTYFLVLVIAAVLLSSDGLLDRPYFSFAYGNIFQSVTSETNGAYHSARPIAFVGDVMLARDVEQYMRRYGTSYPFGIFADLPSYEYLIGNFEAAIPKEHEPTPANTLRFSVPKDHLSALSTAGFTHLSLANNHSYDFGGAGYLSSLLALRRNDITAFGHPSQLVDDTVAYIDYEDTSIALIGLHTLEGVPSAAAMETLLEDTSSNSDLQVAFVHWGEEYELTADKQQATFARQLIDDGIDLVVGHHPHVVQEVEAYRGKLIFYSLGNFVFDQYFSDEVAEGMILEVSRQEDGYSIGIVPVSTQGSRIRPRLLTGYERDRFLESFVDRSDQTLRRDLRDGRLHLSNELAY